MKNPFSREHYVAAAIAIGEHEAFDEPLDGALKLSETVALFDAMFTAGRPGFNRARFHASVRDAVAARRKRAAAPLEQPQG
jgi:hypothetical protein